MRKAIKLGSGVGFALAVLGPLTAVILYPRAKWLFAFALVGVGVLVLNHLLAKDSSPATLADQIEAFLNGKNAGWDVDDFEHQHISNPQAPSFLAQEHGNRRSTRRLGRAGRREEE